jgi:hypothetical protein
MDSKELSKAEAMIGQPSPNSPAIRESKINYKSPVRHPLARFVTEETVALMFNIRIEDIHRIDCKQHVVYVHAKTVSRFVSYADFPPILGVSPPQWEDVARWLKRWRKRWLSHLAPPFWTEFYIYQFKHARSVAESQAWGKLVAQIRPILSVGAVQQLRKAQRPDSRSNF